MKFGPKRLPQHVPLVKITIRVFRFQPFASRKGQEPMIGLKFTFNWQVVSTLKQLLKLYRGQAANSSMLRYSAGGWLSQYACWFVEPVVWPDMQNELRQIGCKFSHIPYLRH